MTSTAHNRIMALDVGTKTVGIATTDPMGIIVQPLTTLRYKTIQDPDRVFAELKKILEEYEPQTIVVGLPINMDETEGSQVRKVREFVFLFQKFLKKKSYPKKHEWKFWDERRTTLEAEEFLISQDVSRAKRKTIIDKMAAVYILKSFLEWHT